MILRMKNPQDEFYVSLERAVRCIFHKMFSDGNVWRKMIRLKG